MLPRPRLFVKKRGSRRTGTRSAAQVMEGLICVALMVGGAIGLYWLVDRVTTAEGAGWWPWFAMVIPVAIFVYGLVGFVSLVWRSTTSTERRAAAVQKATDWELPGVDARPSRPVLPNVPEVDVVTDSAGVRLAYRLPIETSSGWVSFTMAAVCLGWNTFVAIFVVHVIDLHREGKPIWLLTWLMVPFVLAGLWTLVELGRQVLLNIAIGTTRIEISQHPFYPDGIYQGFVSQTGRLRVRWLQVQLVCEEQAIYQQGTDTRRGVTRVYRATMFSQRKFEITPRKPFEAQFGLKVPNFAMHSFVSTHNSINWFIAVCGRMARWGDFERRFPIYVYPAPAPKRSDRAPELSTTNV
jgi:hypothetical protein